MLEKEAVDRALLHLTTMGDTDIFPAPFEFIFYGERGDEISQRVTELDASKVKPKSCIEVLCPKRELAYRIAQQLYPADTLLYTAAVRVAHLLLRSTSDNSTSLRAARTLRRARWQPRQKLLLLGLLKDPTTFANGRLNSTRQAIGRSQLSCLVCSCLAKGEYETWLATIAGQLADPFEAIYRKWLEFCHGQLFDKLRVEFAVKSKSERMAEMFADLGVILGTSPAA